MTPGQRLSLIDRIGGASAHEPEDMAAGLSPAAQALVERALDGIAPGRRRDFHAHALGIGGAKSGAWLNPRLLTWRHPLERMRAKIFMSGAGVHDEGNADGQYAERLLRLHLAMPGGGRVHILAFDWRHGQDGVSDRDESDFYVSNDRVVELALKHPDVFEPVCSVHPYRPDALEELDRMALLGVRFVKWLPNAQGMDPMDWRIEPYYRRLVENRMILLTHAGKEQGVNSSGLQHLGNPLRFRPALELGVTVIMAHAASLGHDEDFDNENRRTPSWKLLLRLLEDDVGAGRGNLFADISATTLTNRVGAPLKALLERPHLHGRLVDGSDYPLPAVNSAISIGQAVRVGLLDPADRAPLKEIFGYNPLMFDLALKRAIRHPDTGARLPASVFMAPPKLDVSWREKQ